MVKSRNDTDCKIASYNRPSLPATLHSLAKENREISIRDSVGLMQMEIAV